MDAELLLSEVLPEPERWQPLSGSEAMKLAIQEALKGAGSVSPNPLVGCVVLDSANRFLSKGYHARWGKDHAEVDAIKKLSPMELKGAQVFVTLEPCAHQGKTPSCAKMLAALPIQKVIYGLGDPNPLVSGAGKKILLNARIQTLEFKETNAQDKEEIIQSLEELAEHFFCNMRLKRPFVSIKVAASLDAVMALNTGESKWITGDQARSFAHYLRAYHDAVVVGADTLTIDDPQLNIRLKNFSHLPKKVVILDKHGRSADFLAQSQLLKVHAAENIHILSFKDRPQSLPGGLLWHNQTEAKPAEGLQILWDQGIRSLLVEGGAKAISSFINNNLADRLYYFQAPVILGGKTGRIWTEQVSIGSMSDRKELRNIRRRLLGSDWLVTGRL